MKKTGILVLLVLHTVLLSEEKKFLERITKQAKVSRARINTEKIQYDHLLRFQNELTYFMNDYGPFWALLENLNNALNAYSKQPISYQKQYRNVVQLNALIGHIKQKNLIRAITKLLQYKTPVTVQADAYIKNLKKLIQSIEEMIAQLSSNKELTVPFIDNPPEKIAEVTIADYFKNYLGKQFFFKIKKIKRSVINWDSKKV